RQSRRLHGDDFAVLVQGGEGDQRAEQGGERQEALNEQRHAQRNIVPQLGLAVAGHGKNLARLPQEVERHQHHAQQNENGEGPRQEQSDEVKRQASRGNKIEVDIFLSSRGG